VSVLRAQAEVRRARRSRGPEQIGSIGLPASACRTSARWEVRLAPFERWPQLHWHLSI